MKTLPTSTAIVFAIFIFLPCLALASTDAESTAVFKILDSRFGTPKKVRYSYDESTGLGQVVATYKGFCEKVTGLPCIRAKVNIIYPILGLTFEPEIGGRGSLVYRRAEDVFVCAYKNWRGRFKPTGACSVTLK